jgi:hypothetical protein
MARCGDVKTSSRLEGDSKVSTAREFIVAPMVDELRLM